MAKIKVKNRSAGSAVYTIPELGDKRNIHRNFAPFEVKELDREEIEALTYIPGGQKLLAEYLQILDEQVIAETLPHVEPEYNLDEAGVKKLMLEGSLDAFLDCLDFAPAGVIDLIKAYAVSLPLNDSAKREAILQKLKFNVDEAIKNDRASKEPDKGGFQEITRERRVKNEPAAPARRTTTDYKVVKMGE